MSKKINVSDAKSKDKIPLITALANKFIKSLGIVEKIDDLIKWDKSKWNVSPGNLIKATILATFQDIRPSFNKIDSNFEGFDCEYLFGENVTAQDINQYNVGRALEKFYDTDMESFYETIALDCIYKNNIPNKMQHADTTSLSFYGDYNLEDLDLSEKELEEMLLIEHGYNKDNKPKCKQIVVGHMVNESGFITSTKAMNGSTSDIEWNKEAIKQMQNLVINGLKEGILVADSKLVTKDLLEQMRSSDNKVSFVSRCPSNFAEKLEDKMIEKTYSENAFSEIGKIVKGKQASSYKGKSYEIEVNKIPVRLLVLHSTALESKANYKLHKQKVKLEPLIKELVKKEFSCEADAKLEYDRFLKNNIVKLFDINFSIEYKKIEKPLSSRKNAKNNLTTKEIYKIGVNSYDYNEIKKKEYLQRESCFVIISDKNISELSDIELLKIYKEQHVVEGSFRMLKQPCLAYPYFLKKTERIHALTVVFTIAMLIRAVIQYRIRDGLNKHNEENPETVLRLGWNNKPLKNPTYYLVYEHCRNLYFEKQSDLDYTFSFFNCTLDSNIKAVLALIGFDIYDLLN